MSYIPMFTIHIDMYVHIDWAQNKMRRKKIEKRDEKYFTYKYLSGANSFIMKSDSMLCFGFVSIVGPIKLPPKNNEWEKRSTRDQLS